jgi:phenylpyruvate tautomerase PptA (4-oxalocrotonate tautomerase family)
VRTRERRGRARGEEGARRAPAGDPLPSRHAGEALGEARPGGREALKGRVAVHLRAGRSAPQKQAILDTLHAAFVDALKIPPGDRNQLVHEYAPEHFEARYGPEAVFVEAVVFPGRSVDAKRKLYRAIADGLAAAGVARDQILIVLHEPPLENWGIRGGQAACDVQLGFKIDV